MLKKGNFSGIKLSACDLKIFLGLMFLRTRISVLQQFRAIKRGSTKTIQSMDLSNK